MKNRLLKLSVFFVLSLLLVQASLSFAAEQSSPPKMTLYNALAEAYQRNPDLEAARAKLRSVDELYIQAEAGFKPSVSAAADYTSSHRGLGTSSGTGSDPKSLSLDVTQSIYSGGSTRANVVQSENTIKAERARLQVVEQQVLLDGVTAYMNFIRDAEIVELNSNNEKVLTSHLQAARERFKLGDITKTDVSQAESRLAKATADRIGAEGDLKASRAFFEKVIGFSPLDLQKPKLALALPATQQESVTLADKNNPNITFAQYTENAAKATTRSIEGENLPQLDLTGSISKVYDASTAATGDAQALGIRATLPLYTGGSTSSRIRQSQQIENQLRMQTLSAERTAHQAAVEAWEGYAAATAQSKALLVQIEAARLALEGVKVEASFGSRTTLDLLDAEQEYLNAQVAYVSAEATRIIAAYALLSSIGNLTADELGLKVAVYDPAANFQKLTKKGLGSKAAIFRGDFRKITE